MSRVGIIALGAGSCSLVAVWGLPMRGSTLQLCSPEVPISQHLPREGPWREIPAGHSWDVQLCFPAPFTLCLPRADCDLRDLQDMQEEEGDTGDSVGLELAQNQPAKPVSACLSLSQVCSAPAVPRVGPLLCPAPAPAAAWLMLAHFCSRFPWILLLRCPPLPLLRITTRKRCPWALGRPLSTSPPAVSPAPSQQQGGGSPTSCPLHPPPA